MKFQLDSDVLNMNLFIAGDLTCFIKLIPRVSSRSSAGTGRASPLRPSARGSKRRKRSGDRERFIALSPFCSNIEELAAVKVKPFMEVKDM